MIVVLVILAILAAILVPALLGWIDKAKEKQLVLDARNAYLAAQTLASEEYGKKTPNRSNVTNEKVIALADLPSGCTFTWSYKSDISTERAYYEVVPSSYSNGTKTIYYSEGEWTSTQ